MTVQHHPETLLARNLDILRRMGNADIADRVAAMPAALAPGVFLRPDGSALYQPDERTYVAAQLHEFAATPKRHFLSIRGAPHASPQIAHRAMREMMEGLQGRSINPLPDLDSGFLLSFGLGRGGHLMPLVENFSFQDFIVLEPNLDYIRRCLRETDWSELADTLQRRDMRLHLLHDPDPVELARRILVPIRSRNLPRLDGMFVFTHYRDTTMDPVIAEVQTILPIIEANDGFFEDEQKMLKHAVVNCLTNPHHVLFDKAGRSLKEIPVFVAGAGPSLDDSLEDIRRNRENVILVSCSTSLRPLLANGLKPDFHVEVENTADCLTIVEDAAGMHDLSDIIFLGTNTVPPEVPAHFGHSILYWRETVVPSRLFSTLDQHLNLAGPSVANLAIRAFLSMGFYEFYLFGIDMGSRDPSQHHSKSSIYYDRQDDYWNSGARMEPFAIPQPGNMRDTVYTNASFLLCKLYLDRLFLYFRNHFFFNCSDGVRLARAPAVNPKQINAMTPETPRATLIHACLSELENSDPGRHVPVERLQAYAGKLEDWFDEALSVAGSERLGTSRDLAGAFQPLLGFSSTEALFSVDSAAKGMCTGTVGSILQFGHFLERRLPAGRPRRLHARVPAGVDRGTADNEAGKPDSVARSSRPDGPAAPSAADRSLNRKQQRHRNHRSCRPTPQPP